jgi:hypothetical protein
MCSPENHRSDRDRLNHIGAKEATDCAFNSSLPQCAQKHKRLQLSFTRRIGNIAVRVQRQHHNAQLILRCVINAHSNNLRRLQLETLALSPDQDLADIARADIAKEYPGPLD